MESKNVRIAINYRTAESPGFAEFGSFEEAARFWNSLVVESEDEDVDYYAAVELSDGDAYFGIEDIMDVTDYEFGEIEEALRRKIKESPCDYITADEVL